MSFSKLLPENEQFKYSTQIKLTLRVKEKNIRKLISKISGRTITES